MIKERRTRLSLAVVMMLALALGTAPLPGCAKKAAVTSGPTALANLSVARSALSTIAPDAKLMSVNTYMRTVPGVAPAWIFTFGSPSGNDLFRVFAAGGKLIFVQKAGGVGLAESAWSSIPGTDIWKIDSDAAYTKALAASGARGTPATYGMGFETIKSSMDASAAAPMVWRVTLTPATGGAATATVDVNATTGAATVVK